MSKQHETEPIGTVRVIGHDYEVQYDPQLALSHDAPAMMCPDILRIVIDPNAPESRQFECLLHEIIEALNYHLELNLKHPQITALGEGLFQVLRDNQIDFGGMNA